MVVAGIARRHIGKTEAAGADGTGSAVDAREAFIAWLLDTLPELQVETVPAEDEAAIDTHVDGLETAIRAFVPELLRRANAELSPDRPEHNPPGSYRIAMLAWFSGRTEIPAGDILEWSKAQVLEVIETHGSLVAWHAWRRTEDAREVQRDERMVRRYQAVSQRIQDLMTAGLTTQDAVVMAQQLSDDEYPVEQPEDTR
jgi:hypothetical protein